MKIKIFLVFILLAYSQITFGQKRGNGPDKYIKTDKGMVLQPKFVGGVENFFHFIKANYQLPKQKGLYGKVLIQFVVEKDGSIGDIKLIQDIGYGTGEEAIRLMKASPKWIPGTLDGEAVSVLYTLPIEVDTR